MLILYLTMTFIDENIPGGVMRGAEWHSHLGSMKVRMLWRTRLDGLRILVIEQKAAAFSQIEK